MSGVDVPLAVRLSGVSIVANSKESEKFLYTSGLGKDPCFVFDPPPNVALDVFFEMISARAQAMPQPIPLSTFQSLIAEITYR
jgi:hypothetical protein